MNSQLLWFMEHKQLAYICFILSLFYIYCWRFHGLLEKAWPCVASVLGILVPCFARVIRKQKMLTDTAYRLMILHDLAKESVTLVL